MLVRPSIIAATLGVSVSICIPSASASGPQAVELDSRKGRPTVKLDRLTFPPIPNKRIYEKHLRTVLLREARRAEWGVGRGHKIEYRFEVQELQTIQKGNVLRVKCSAVGALPKGKSAKSQLSFGGDPKKQRELIKRVLEIVARGVITRLAEMERLRRGQLDRSRVRAPVSG